MKVTPQLFKGTALFFILILMSCSNDATSESSINDSLKSMQEPRKNFNSLDSTSAAASNAVRLAPPQSIQLEILASETAVTEGEWTGHAFMIISIPLSSGIKEDGYGFYPKDGGIGQIYGPGIVQSETNHNPGRLSRIAVSIKKPITEEQRRSILQLTNEWNTRNFRLTNQNCIDFIKAAASRAGWSTVDRTTGEFPAAYVRRLKEANE